MLALTGLHQKPRKGEDIFPHHYPPPISDQLTRTPHVYGEQEGPSLVSDAHGDMDDERDAEKRNENAVRSQ